MKGFPPQPEGPMGPWYKRVNARLAEARQCETLDALIDLMGEPDRVEVGDKEMSASEFVNVLSTGADFAAVDVTVSYVDPYRTRNQHQFSFEAAQDVGPTRPLNDFDEIEVERQNLEPTDPSEIDAAESWLHAQFPSGYREFLSRFGEGTLASFIRIYPPQRIIAGSNCLEEWRARINKYWFWDKGADVLTKARALECVIVADTVDGDEMVVHPSDADTIYVLPRHQETIHVASKDGLLAACDWLLNSGELGPPISARHFRPFRSTENE